MKIKKLLSLVCSFSIFSSSLFCCKAEGHTARIEVGIFGNKGVGKTQICSCLSGQPDNISTFECQYKNDSVLFTLFDSTCVIGHANRRLNGSDVGIFVCDVNDINSIYAFDKWFKFYRDNSKNNNCNVIIALNKCDLSNGSDLENMRKILIKKLKKIKFTQSDAEARVISFSAKENNGIDILRQCLVNTTQQIIEQRLQEEINMERRPREEIKKMLEKGQQKQSPLEQSLLEQDTQIPRKNKLYDLFCCCGCESID